MLSFYIAMISLGIDVIHLLWGLLATFAISTTSGIRCSTSLLGTAWALLIFFIGFMFIGYDYSFTLAVNLLQIDLYILLCIYILLHVGFVKEKLVIRMTKAQ